MTRRWWIEHSRTRSYVLATLLVFAAVLLGLPLLRGTLADGAVRSAKGSSPTTAAGVAPQTPTDDGVLIVRSAADLVLWVSASALDVVGSVTSDTRLETGGALPIPKAPTSRSSSSASVAREDSVLVALWGAYDRATRRAPQACRLPISLLVAIGHVESGSLAGRRLDAAGRVVPPVLGPVLSGGAVASIPDTDGGVWDGNATWDRALGPMQFIPGTWRAWGTDGNGDGVADPQNIADATLTAARYLCAGNRDLSNPADLRAAVLAYNHSPRYLDAVLSLMNRIEQAGPG